MKRRKYKFQGGIQRIQNDTPDYTGAYKLRAEQNAKNQIGENIGAAAANIAMPGLGTALQGVGAISDSLTKDAKGNYKNKFAEAANIYTNPLGTASKTLSALTGNKTAAADLWSGTLGVFGAKNIFGKTTQEKVKDAAIAEERKTNLANINKRYSEATATDAQAQLAKRGKYKVKTKQPRMIETEGREPIFSPKKADGSRDLLYYNPNDPTHEEGGVKAIVMPRRSKESLLPKAQLGKQTVKASNKGSTKEKKVKQNISEKWTEEQWRNFLKNKNQNNNQTNNQIKLNFPKFDLEPKFEPDATTVYKQPLGVIKEDPQLVNLKKELYKPGPKTRQQIRNTVRQIIKIEKAQEERNDLRRVLDSYREGMSADAKWEDLNTSSFNNFLETAWGRHRDMTPEQRDNITKESLIKWMKENPQESKWEDIVEIFDPTGVTSWDDVRRKRIEMDESGESDRGGMALELLGAIPGGFGKPFKGTTKAITSAPKFTTRILGKAKGPADIGAKVFTPTIGAANKLKKVVSTTTKVGTDVADEISDYLTLHGIIESNYPDDSENSQNNKAYGAKQLKVNELNNTALSSNLNSMPAANAANQFTQPMAGISQVARNIPEYRRKEKQNTLRSHKKQNPDTNRIIDPPMLYEMKPPPPRSTFNTKNNFQEGVNELEGDLISKVIMNRNRDKDFVQRAYAVGKNKGNMFTVFDDFDTKATHLMENGADEKGQEYMYPTIMNPKNEAVKVPNQYANYIGKFGYKKAAGMNKGSKKVKVYR